jgi:hypothetical protein
MTTEYFTDKVVGVAITGFKESGGAVLTFGAIPDATILRRVGTAVVGMAGLALGSFPIWDGDSWEDSVRATDSREVVTVMEKVGNNAACAAGYDQFCASSQTGYSYDAGGDVSWEWIRSVQPSAAGPQCDWVLGYKSGGAAFQERLRLGSAATNTMTGILYATLGARFAGDPAGNASTFTIGGTQTAAGGATAAAAFPTIPAGATNAWIWHKCNTRGTAGWLPVLT